MSFTNDQVTAKNFKDFYRKVLPYLKGTDHNLSYSELLDLSTMIYPPAVARGGQLFYDRSGRASIVGSSTVNTSGNGAPLYEQLIVGTTPNTKNGYVSTGLLEGAIEPANVQLCSIIVDSGEFTKNVVDFAAISNDGGTIAFSFPDTDAIYLNKPFIAKVRFVDKNKAIAVYGAIWDGSSNPAWTRTDLAAGFSDPNPYYANMTDTPSSPFDTISPWKDLRIVEDANAGTLVEIPKFYYKWTRSGASMQLQISDVPFMGSHVSPAHSDRGDGVGERDYVYIGRYQCSNSNYKSTSGVVLKSTISRGNARTGIQNLGTDIWQEDFTIFWTIRMLYLVEFAHWDSQAKIGFGGGNNSAKQNSGASDAIPYHTGTIRATRSTYGVGVQYRYIEDLWANLWDWIEGIYFSGGNIYCVKNPNLFPGTENGILVGQRALTTGFVKEWTNPTVPGYEYALYPSAVDSSLDGTTYCCDNSNYSSSGVVLCTGGYWNHVRNSGMLCLNGSCASNNNEISRGCRLMKLPPSRLS